MAEIELTPNNPMLAGWYPTLHTWEPSEGFFPGAHWWTGSEWQKTPDSPPTRASIWHWCVRYESKDEAKAYADAHDPEW